MASPFSTAPQRESGISGKVLLIAAAVVLVLVAIVAAATLHRAPVNSNVEEPADAYAPQIAFTGITLSEATNGAGGKVTYLDGSMKNNGPQTLSAARLQVTFLTADGSAPQRETVPLTLVRTRQPYVDLEPVSAEPVKPGQSRDFRLIFETVPANWNTDQPPVLRLIHAGLE